MSQRPVLNPRLRLTAVAVLCGGVMAACVAPTTPTATATAVTTTTAKPVTTTTAKSTTTTAKPVTTTTAKPSTTTTTARPAATTTTIAAPATTTTVAAPTGHFSTLPVGATLPDDATCAARVRPAAETRSANTVANHTTGTQKNLTQPYPLFSRVDGNFTGTTDEIIQWTACKWGIDEDIVRAQAAKESWWYQRTVGDFQTNAAICVPGHGIGVDGVAGQCPASGGLLALTYQYYTNGFPEAMNSTAYNLDYVYAWWRSCYTGQVTWLNTVDRGTDYAAGDVWGCVGTWFAGRWHTAAAEGYISGVQAYLSQKVWTTPGFLGS